MYMLLIHDAFCFSIAFSHGLSDMWTLFSSQFLPMLFVASKFVGREASVSAFSAAPFSLATWGCLSSPAHSLWSNCAMDFLLMSLL